MSEDVWQDLHQNYAGQAWIDKPSIFAEIKRVLKPGGVLAFLAKKV